MTALDEEFSTGLARCERNVVVTTHEAFGYLAHRYGLEMVGISGLSPDAEPSPARLAEVREVVVDEGVTTIFSNGWSARRWLRRWPTISASARRFSTPSRA